MTLDAEYIAELRRDLADVRQAIRDVINGGAEFSIAGGITQKRVSLPDLEARERKLARKLIVATGGSTRTVPDFTGDTAT